MFNEQVTSLSKSWPPVTLTDFNSHGILQSTQRLPPRSNLSTVYTRYNTVHHSTTQYILATHGKTCKWLPPVNYPPIIQTLPQHNSKIYNQGKSPCYHFSLLKKGNQITANTYTAHREKIEVNNSLYSTSECVTRCLHTRQKLQLGPILNLMTNRVDSHVSNSHSPPQVVPGIKDRRNTGGEPSFRVLLLKQKQCTYINGPQPSFTHTYTSITLPLLLLDDDVGVLTSYTWSGGAQGPRPRG